MRLIILAAACAASIAMSPAGAAVLDTFDGNTASGLGSNWTQLKNGGQIVNGQATGGTQSLFTYTGSGAYSANNVGFDFYAASNPQQSTYYDLALLDWNGTTGYFMKVQHQLILSPSSNPPGFNKYAIGTVAYNSTTQLFTYTNLSFVDIGETLTSGHLDASIVGNQATLTLTGGAITHTLNYTFTGQPLSGSMIGLGIGDAAKLDNYASTLAAVPEPASWALFIAGFGAIGAAMRTRQRALVAAKG